MLLHLFRLAPQVLARLAGMPKASNRPAVIGGSGLIAGRGASWKTRQTQICAWPAVIGEARSRREPAYLACQLALSQQARTARVRLAAGRSPTAGTAGRASRKATA
jgi:hypothetical protein